MKMILNIFLKVQHFLFIFQTYPQRMRLQRLLCKICLVRFLAFVFPCRLKLAYFGVKSLSKTSKYLIECRSQKSSFKSYQFQSFRSSLQSHSLRVTLNIVNLKWWGLNIIMGLSPPPIPHHEKSSELLTLEWWISGLMLNPNFFLISRLNMACSPYELNLQKSQQIGIKDITF